MASSSNSQSMLQQDFLSFREFATERFRMIDERMEKFTDLISGPMKLVPNQSLPTLLTKKNKEGSIEIPTMLQES